MWPISDRFSVSSPGVLEGFDAGWFYRSCWKCSPFTLMHSWYLRANDCVSLIIAAASATWATSSSGVSIGVSYTKHFISPKIKKSIAVRSGERGGHCTGPPLPIQRLGKHCSGILWHQGQSVLGPRHAGTILFAWLVAGHSPTFPVIYHE